MFGGLENLAGIGALALEDAGAIVQAMGQDVDLGVLPRHDLAIEPDPTVALVEGNDRHGLMLLSGLYVLRNGPECLVRATTFRYEMVQRNKDGKICQYG